MHFRFECDELLCAQTDPSGAIAGRSIGMDKRALMDESSIAEDSFAGQVAVLGLTSISSRTLLLSEFGHADDGSRWTHPPIIENLH